MNKKLLTTALIVIVILVAGFFLLKPAAPDLGSIAMVTQNQNNILPLPELQGQIVRYTLEDNASMQRTGRKIGGEHRGNISIEQGALAIDENQNFAGKFIINMDTIKVDDLEEGSVMHGQLLGHLKGGFFDVENYPTADFTLKKATLRADNIYDVVGDLKIVGVSNEISFPAIINIENDYVEVKANFFIDRSAWGITEVIEIADRYIEFGLDLYFNKR